MPEYAARTVGNVSDRWTKKGQEKEMDALSATISQYAQEGWRLHSIQPVTLYGGVTNQPHGVILLAVYEK